MYKIIFNSCLILILEKKYYIPQEVIKEQKNQVAILITLTKKLVTDILNQKKTASIVSSADTINYYNKIVHPFASLCR